MKARLLLCASAVLLSRLALVSQTVQGFQTTTDLTRTLAPLPKSTFGKTAEKAAPVSITVDDSKRLQIMDGFGASITEGTAWLLQHQVTPAQRDAIMTKLFDPKAGVGLSFLRQPIASTDLSRTHYSYDDMPDGEQDPALQHFSVEKDRADIFPLVRQALKLNQRITIMATPWSPPAWMKTKPTMNGGELRPDAEPAYAAYLVRSLQAFAKEGVPVKFLSIQNEPLNETHNYPGTLLKADQAKRFIGQDLGPALRRAGLQTQVLAYDHNWDHPEYPLEVLADAAARPFVAGSAMHCYGGAVTAQDGIHAAEPDKGIWMTECSGGTWQKQSPLAVTANLLIGSTQHWAKAVVLWGIALDPQGNPHAGGCGTCRGLVTIDAAQSPATVTYTGDFYGLAHASRFVHPGATHIVSSASAEGLQQVAFQNTDGSIALLIFNAAEEPSELDVNWHARTAHLQVPEKSLVTYTWTANRKATQE